MKKPRRSTPVTESEIESDVLAFLAHCYEGRPLDFDVARRAMANIAHRLAVMKIEGSIGKGKR